jgi:ATP-dependent RNA helicase DDX18/HAS1
VLDETDVLFMDDSFALQPLGANAPPTAQFVFVTATLPDVVVQQIAQEFPTVKKLTGPGLHKVAPTIDETLIDCSGPPSELKNKETGSTNRINNVI